MKQLIITGILTFLTLLNLNCSGTKEITEIKPKIIYPPVIEDSIKVVEKSDTVIIGMIVKTARPGLLSGGHACPFGVPSLQQNDTTTIIKYFPKLEKFYIKVKPDSIIIFDTIKTVQTIEKNIETPFLSKVGLVMIGIIITVIGIYLLGKRG